MSEPEWRGPLRKLSSFESSYHAFLYIHHFSPTVLTQKLFFVNQLDNQIGYTTNIAGICILFFMILRISILKSNEYLLYLS